MSAIDKLRKLVEDSSGDANSPDGLVISDTLIDELIEEGKKLKEFAATIWSACQDDIFYDYKKWEEPGSSYENTINGLCEAANELHKLIDDLSM
jgi:hypothetical protein